MIRVLVTVYYDETEVFADELIKQGFVVDKLYLSALLKDEFSITYDEMKKRYDVIVIDGFLSEPLIRYSWLNHAKYFFLFFDGRDDNDKAVLDLDYSVIQVKDYEDKTRDDWAKAAVFFGQKISESVGGEPGV